MNKIWFLCLKRLKSKGDRHTDDTNNVILWQLAFEKSALGL